MIGGVILLRHHRDRNVLGVLGGFAGMILLMALFVAHKAPTYAVLVWPFGALLVGRWLTVAVGRTAAIGTLATTSLASVLALSIVAASEWQGDYDQFVGGLRSHIPAGATIQGEPTYWFGLADYPYMRPVFRWRPRETVRRVHHRTNTSSTRCSRSSEEEAEFRTSSLSLT
jgi:hypothetical protein